MFHNRTFRHFISANSYDAIESLFTCFIFREFAYPKFYLLNEHARDFKSIKCQNPTEWARYSHTAHVQSNSEPVLQKVGTNLI